MKTKALKVTVILSHLLVFGILLTRMGVVTFVARSPEIGEETLRAIWTQTAVLTVPAILLLIGVAGLVLARPWGWRAAAVADVILIGLVIGDWLFGGQRVDHGPVLAILIVLLLPLLVPRVRALLTSVFE